MSFLEKLKEDIGVEEELEEVKEKPKRKKKVKKPDTKAKKVDQEDFKIKVASEKPKKAKEKWFEAKGELTVDVFQTENYLVIQSVIAGVKLEDLDIFIEDDVLTIEGNREQPKSDEERNYFYQECYWGPFYRRIILQEEVDNSRTEAVMKNGVLTIQIPKIQRKKKRKVPIKA